MLYLIELCENVSYVAQEGVEPSLMVKLLYRQLPEPLGHLRLSLTRKWRDSNPRYPKVLHLSRVTP